MPLILFIRHGENDYMKEWRLPGRIPGVHLNEKGRQQAQALAEKLAQAPLKAIYSSPLERTMETAEPLARALGQAVIPRQGLIETDCGEWQGETVKKLRRLKAWKTVQNAPSLFCFPGGESIAESQRRICGEVEALCSLHEPKDVIACFGHADPIKLAVAFYLGMPLDLFQRLVIEPAQIAALQIGEGGACLLALNADPAFPGVHPPKKGD
ncbi:MAG: histidine phosphatase family protein [Anaerolineales bacterium]|nr:histidine phosphatase family protein [Anaerolineales bacterium]